MSVRTDSKFWSPLVQSIPPTLVESFPVVPNLPHPLGAGKRRCPARPGFGRERWHRTAACLPLLFVLAVFLEVFPTELRGSSAAAGAPQVQVLDDFESELARGRWEGSVRRTAVHSAHGRYALEVKFDARARTLSASLPKADWSPFQRLRSDVFNPEPRPVILSFDLYDAGHDEGGAEFHRYDYYSGEGKVFLGSGWTHVEFVLSGLRTTSELRPIALGRIRRFTLTAQYLTRAFSLYFDNFRLVGESEPSLTKSREAPEDLKAVIEGRSVSVTQVGPLDAIPESEALKKSRQDAEREYQSLREAVTSAAHLGLDTTYSEAELTTAEIGLYLRPQFPWFNNPQQKQVLFRDVMRICAHERERLRTLMTGELRLPVLDDTQVAGPLIPPYPHLRGLPSQDGFFRDPDGRPLFIVSLHGPTGNLLRFFATPRQHIESYSVGGGSRWTVDDSPVYAAFQKYPDTHRVGWDGWCGHLVRDLDSMGGKKENVVICLESPHIREAVERYIRDNVAAWTQNPELLYNILGYELQYICYCERSQQMFRTWLEKKHSTISRLNEAWGTHYVNFQEIVAPPTKEARPLPGTNRAQWYDWACFNQERFTDYLVWVKSVVRRYDSTTPIAAGGSSSMLVGGNGTSGIDEEQIINRVDDVILHEGSGSTLGMDLQLALSEQRKPLADPEMNLGKPRNLLPHMLHGKSAIQIWQWPDQPASEYPQSTADSPPHSWDWSLDDISALFRAVLDARRLSPEIAAFSSAPAQVAILYSKTSVLQVPPTMLTWESTPYLRELERTYEAARCLDTAVTFVSESQILSGKLSKFRVLLVPAASHERAEVAQAIDRFAADGGTVLLLPPSFVSDEYNRPLSYLQQLGITVRRIEQPLVDRTGDAEQSYDQTFRERVVYRSESAVNLVDKSGGLLPSGLPGLRGEGTRMEIDLPSSFKTLAAFPDGKPALAFLEHGKGRIHFAATAFPIRDLSSLLDSILDGAEVSRPVRVRSADGMPLGNVEARFVDVPLGKLVYIVNAGTKPIRTQVEVDGRTEKSFYDLRSQEGMASEVVRVPAEETVILRLGQ